ncbi:MAG: phosphate/phosphite/phosphonate ABC transporter substrate-binding protein [Gammaproteobacteria bacterium]|jgi:phosphonate transport system substrate-binding protein|nr:phosphate/phosphite/phosphonate ABC transporter substrate-binding protein [Gammaproteobacteria bacterium]
MLRIKPFGSTFVLLSIACFGLFFSYPSTAVEKVYKFGVVPQFDARRIKNIWQPILDAVSKQSGLQFELLGSANIPTFEKQFAAGEFDFAYMNPYHLIKAREAQNYQPLLRDIGRQLYGIIVVRKDSSIQQVTDLQGKTVAFPAPNALGAALIPRTEFGEIYKINVQPKYVRSHDSVYLNVLLGQADAGGGVQKTFNKQPQNVRDALKIIYQTRKVAPHPLAVHPRVPEAVKKKILESFLALGNSAQGRALLKEIPMNQIGTATMEDYDALINLGLDKYFLE